MFLSNHNTMCELQNKTFCTVLLLYENRSHVLSPPLQ